MNAIPLITLFDLDYNTRVVLLGAMLLGAACGLVGVFLLLRKRALVGDAISHATLPGVCTVYLISLWANVEGKSLVWLLLGGAASGGLGALTIVFLRKWTRLKEDAVLGIVLSVYFAIGTALLRMIQKLPEGNSAGLEGFIFGKTALMVTEDVWVIGFACAVVILLTLLLNKELKLLCFDTNLARAQGWPTTGLDLLLMASVVTIVVVGLQAVGMILVIALLVIPAASARFWTHRMGRMMWISVAIGALSGMLGAMLSSWLDRVPSGPAIVLVAIVAFGMSFLFGIERGICWRTIRLFRHRATTDEQHVLRGAYEILELQNEAPLPIGAIRSPQIDIGLLVELRHWSRSRIRNAIRKLKNDGSITTTDLQQIELSAKGIRLASEAVRRHRLLEYYFRHQAQFRDEAVDRGADMIEHDIDDDMMAMLEQQFGSTALAIPESLHPIKVQDSQGSIDTASSISSASNRRPSDEDRSRR